MSQPYLPRREGELRSFCSSFSNHLNADPEAFGIAPEVAAQYALTLQAFRDALIVTGAPDTRTSTAIIRKNEARDALIALTRGLARQIQGRAQTTDAQRSALGLTIRDRNPTRTPRPKLAPQLNIVTVNGRTVTIRLRDIENPDRRARPEHIAGAGIMVFIGDKPPPSPHKWTYYAQTSKTSATVQFASTVPSGARVHIGAFWLNRRGEAGPLCPPQSTIVTDGAMPSRALTG